MFLTYNNRTLFGHIVSREGIVVDPRKIKLIIEASTPKNAKALSFFLKQIQRNTRMLHYLANFATSRHVVVHHTSFEWKEIEDKACMALKFMLTQASVVQPPE